MIKIREEETCETSNSPKSVVLFDSLLQSEAVPPIEESTTSECKKLGRKPKKVLLNDIEEIL